MVSLAFSNPKFIDDYRNVVAFLEKKNILYRLFVPASIYKRFVNSGIKYLEGLVRVNLYLSPWIKDYGPIMYLPVFNKHTFISIWFDYKPPYLKKVGKSYTQFRSYFKAYLQSIGIDSLFFNQPLDGGAVVSVVKDGKVLLFVADGWEVDWDFVTFELKKYILDIKVLVFPVENYFKHMDSVLSVFPSLTINNGYCLIYLDHPQVRTWIDEAIKALVDFLKVKVMTYPLPLDDDYYTYKVRFDHYSCVINSLVIPKKRSYISLAYEPSSHMSSILHELSFFDFLNIHGYSLYLIPGNRILMNGGGLACITHNIPFLDESDV